MNRSFGLLVLMLLLNSCNGQSSKNENKIVGGPCQDCEAALDYKLLHYDLKSLDTIPGYNEHQPKLKISGTVFQSDGMTPAENVILYLYHTNRDSIYNPSVNPVGWEKRHGQHRGWLKTDSDGDYTFYTFRPTPYPKAQESEHIHIYIKEPDKIPYYIDNYIFMDDPTLNKKDATSQNNRGGAGLIRLNYKNGILTGSRDIILGLNIPNYK